MSEQQQVQDKPEVKWPWNAAEGSPEVETLRASLEERLDGLTVGDSVRALQNWGSDNEQVDGQVGVLERIDRADARMTFSVTGLDCPGGQMWLHRVGLVEPKKAEAPTLDDVPEPPGTIETMQKQIEDLRAALDARTAEVGEQRVRANDLNTSLIAFQQQVREVAIRVADEQSWCDDGLNEVLEELGLDKKEPPEYDIEVHVTYRFRATRANNQSDEPSEEFITNSLRCIDDPTLDDDFEVESSDYSIDRVTVEEV